MTSAFKVVGSDSPKSHNDTNELSNPGSSRRAAPTLSEPKLLVLLKKFGGFDESIHGKLKELIAPPAERVLSVKIKL